MKWKAISRRELGKVPWDQFVDNCDEAWFFHRFEFLEAVSTTWPNRADGSFAMVDENGSVDAIFSATVIEYRVFFGLCDS